MLQRTLQRIFQVPVGAALLLAATLLFVASGSAVAAPVPVAGPPFLPCASNNSGCFNGGSLSVQVTADTCINFYNGNNADVCGVPGDTFKVNSPADTANFTLQGTGTIKDLIFNTPPPIAFLTVPGPGGTVTFDLTGVIPSAQPACGLNPSGLIACSAGVFTLSQQDLNTFAPNCANGLPVCGQVLVGFGFTANGYLGSSATGTTPYHITFSTQFNNETIADLLLKASQPGGITNAVSFTANPVAAPPTSGGCPATKGFWKNEKQHPFPNTLTFPVTIGGIGYSKADLYTILDLQGGGNAVAIMGSQLVAALLNIAAGAQTNAQVLSAIAQAEGLVNGINMTTGFVSTGSALGQQMLTVKDILDGFNNGFFGACNDGTGLNLGS